MKKLLYLVLLGIGVTGCSVEEQMNMDVQEVNLLTSAENETVRHYFRSPDRYVEVTNDGETLFVKFVSLGDDDGLVNTRLHIVNDPSDFPVNGGGTLPPGQMDNFVNHSGGVAEYTYKFLLADEDFADCIYIAPWAIFKVGQGNTGHYAGDLGGSDRWKYFVYGTCDEIVDQICESAFMLGSHTFYGPKGVATNLNLGNNRWGWAHLMTIDQNSYSADIYAAAGQNNILNGTKVGRVTVNEVGGALNIKIDWAEEPDDVKAYFNLVHIYASNAKPTTTAPGLFGFTDSEPTDGEVYPFNNINLDKPYYIIVHAETCWFE